MADAKLVSTVLDIFNKDAGKNYHINEEVPPSQRQDGDKTVLTLTACEGEECVREDFEIILSADGTIKSMEWQWGDKKYEGSAGAEPVGHAMAAAEGAAKPLLDRVLEIFCKDEGEDYHINKEAPAPKERKEGDKTIISVNVCAGTKCISEEFEVVLNADGSIKSMEWAWGDKKYTA